MSWERFKKSFSHAFKVSDGADELTAEDHELLAQLAQFIVDKRMTTPAILFLESTAPLNFIGSSIMVFFRPIAGWLFKKGQYERLELILEKRASIKLLIEHIEKAENNRENASDSRKSRG